MGQENGMFSQMGHASKENFVMYQASITKN
jgi:hypothetical protein